MLKLGSPVHSKFFFENILEQYGKKAQISSVYYNNICIYSSFYIFKKDVMINCWSSTLNKYRKYYPTDFGIWNTIKDGISNNFKYMDFGRSQYGSSNLEFKRRWGATLNQLHYYYLARSNVQFSTNSGNMNREKFEKLWRLLPLSLSTILGPKIRSSFP